MHGLLFSNTIPAGIRYSEAKAVKFTTGPMAHTHTHTNTHTHTHFSRDTSHVLKSERKIEIDLFVSSESRKKNEASPHCEDIQ